MEAYKLKPGLKMLDSKSKLMMDLKTDMGLGPLDYSDDPFYARVITFNAKKAGFDGVISDNMAEGIVVFDPKNVEEVKS